MSGLISVREAARRLRVAPNQIVAIWAQYYCNIHHRGNKVFVSQDEVEYIREVMDSMEFREHYSKLLPPPQDEPPEPKLMDRIRAVLNRSK